jgi:hypothetical protein
MHSGFGKHLYGLLCSVLLTLACAPAVADEAIIKLIP